MSGKRPAEKKRQTTLFNKGFTKTIVHRGESIDIGERYGKFVEGDPTLLVKCEKCPEKFKTTQALSMHDKWSHQLTLKRDAGQTIDAALSSSSKKSKGVAEKVNLQWRRVCSDIERKRIRDEKDEEKKQNAKGRKGASERRSYDNIFKVDVIQQLEEGGALAVDVAARNNVSKSIVSKWYKDRKSIYDAAAIQHRKLLKKNRRSTKHNAMFKKLIEKFRKTRSIGGKVSFNWIYVNACVINKKLHPDAKRLSKSVAISFIRRYGIKLRRVQRKKQKAKSMYTSTLMSWHSELREGLVKTGSKLARYDSKWGRYKPKQRWNVDQVPMEFAIDRKTTYEEPVEKEKRKDHRVWVANPGSGLDKRQCSLQVCFSPVKDQCRIAIIFRGKGRISPDERAAYHQGVDVYFQKCAWVDRQVALDWAEKTFAPAVKDLQDFVLFCDNLDAQTCEEFRKAVSSLGGVVKYGPAGETDAWQPVDSGFGRLTKSLAFAEQTDWLEHDENMDKWLGQGDKFTAKERRILITHWVGQAWEKLKDPKYDHARWRCFERTGCLLTADGSGDEKVKPENMPDYIVPPPLAIPAGDDPFEQVVPPAEPIPDDTMIVGDIAIDVELRDDDNDQAEVVLEDDVNVDDDVDVDREEDRDMKHNLIGCSIKIFYDNQGDWFVGKIMWMNKRVNKLRVYFAEDDSEDYIGEDEINGMDILLLA